MLVEEQNGFKKGRSCLDHIFVLDAIFIMKFSKKQCLFGCFVDFSSAFDCTKEI